LITVWMFATAVLYPMSNLGDRYRVLLQLNPLTPLIEAYRSVLLRGVLPDASPFLLAAVVSLVLLAFAWLLFHRTEFQFAENV
jgi:lipopolysaccharide transport system permease protein